METPRLCFIGQNNDYPMYLNSFFINLSLYNKLSKNEYTRTLLRRTHHLG